MKKVGLISCASKKHDEPMTVERLYSKSPHFRYATEFCKRNYNAVYAISAKHGLIALSQVIEPYDISLANIQHAEFKEWIDHVSNQIRETIPSDWELYFHAGKRFRTLIPHLDEYKCHVPMKGIGIGLHLHFFIEWLNK